MGRERVRDRVAREAGAGEQRVDHLLVKRGVVARAQDLVGRLHRIYGDARVAVVDDPDRGARPELVALRPGRFGPGVRGDVGCREPGDLGFDLDVGVTDASESYVADG